MKLFHVHLEPMGAADALHGVVPLLSGQSEDRFAVGAFFENVGLSVPPHGAAQVDKAPHLSPRLFKKGGYLAVNS